MNTQRILEALSAKYAAPKPSYQKRRIVFWYDEDASFLMEASSLVPEGVKFLCIDGNTFAAKKTIEHDDQASDYLVYIPKPRPKDRQNYLLDIELYSDSFSADQASLVMDDLGLTSPGLKPMIKNHIKFFQNKERMGMFRQLSPQVRDEEALIQGMLGVLAKQRSMEPSDIIRGVLLGGLDQEENAIYEEVKKQGLESGFWRLVTGHFGYASEHPSLKLFFRAIILSATSEALVLDEAVPWKGYLLPKGARSRALVFVDHWLNHGEHCGCLEGYTGEVWTEIELEKYFAQAEIEVVAMGTTFEAFDHLVIQALIKGIVDEDEVDSKWQGWIDQRRRTHWWPKYQNCYEALDAAINLLEMRRKWRNRFKEARAGEVVKSYTEEYCHADRCYREFATALKKLTTDALHPVAERIEDVYTNWFLPTLLGAWDDIVEKDFATGWKQDNVIPQRDFFRRRVLPLLGEKNKVFILISDGLRYEVAQQLAEELEKDTRSVPDLGWMLGTLPSYTDLCMAALLPNKELGWKGKDVIVDGQVATMQNREKILQVGFKEAAVISYRNLIDWSKEEAREKLAGARIVYVYHNTIDYLGDKVASEDQTFIAAERAIEELKNGVLKICNQLNTTNVLITADHGFLFQRGQVPESDKVSIEKEDKVVGGRRFLVGREGRSYDGSMEMSLDYLLGVGCGLSVYTPRGNNRFQAHGGSRYVHGGHSLQEVVIPVIHHVHARKYQDRAKQSKKVEVQLTNTDKKITDNRWRFHFFQEEAVGTKTLPRLLLAALWKLGDKELKISTEARIVANCESEKASERQMTISLTLNPGIDNGDYFLRLIDEETDMEYRRYPFQVNLAFGKIDFWS